LLSESKILLPKIRFQALFFLFVFFVPWCSAHCRLTKVSLALLLTTAFIGATLCGIIHLTRLRRAYI